MVKQRGFTIVELIMVIVILGIISAVALPRFFDRNTFDERFYFEEVLSSVRYAQKLAVASGCYIRAQASQINGSGVTLYHYNQCGNKAPGEAVSGDSAVTSKTVSINVGTYPGAVVFNSLGCVSETSNCPSDGIVEWTVGATFKLKIYRATGFIEVVR